MRRLLIAGGALIALGGGMALVASPDARQPGWAQGGRPAQTGHAAADVYWRFRPESLKEMTARTTVAVAATVLSVEDGKPLVTSGADDVPPIPTQLVRLKVQERWFGDAPDEITLFKTGSATVWMEGSPPYEAGQTYALFLEQRDDGLYIPVAPDGRLEFQKGGLRALMEGPVGERLNGRTASEAKEAAKSAKEGS